MSDSFRRGVHVKDEQEIVWNENPQCHGKNSKDELGASFLKILKSEQMQPKSLQKFMTQLQPWYMENVV